MIRHGLNTDTKRELRIFVAKRDGCVCHYCGRELMDPETVPKRFGKSDAYPTLDHVKPRSAGGSNSPRNLVLSCGPCNNEKHSKPLDVFLDALSRR